MITLDLTQRAARMLEQGRVTVTFRSPTGRHVTLRARCRAPQEDGRWVTCSLEEAKVVFFEVPSGGAGWSDKVARVTRRGGLVLDVGTDDARAWCARQLLRFLAGQPLPEGLEVWEESCCGRCGRELTDPVSVERGVGPECYGKITGSQHQRKGETAQGRPAGGARG